MKNKLTAKQKLFCREYLVDLNVHHAAKRAGYKSKSYNRYVYRLMADDAVKSYIAELMTARKERLQITSDMVLRDLAAIAFTDIRDFVSLGEEGLVVKAIGDLTPEQARAIESITERTNAHGSRIGIKLHNKLKALELIGRHLAMFTDRVELPQFTAFRIGYEKEE